MGGSTLLLSFLLGSSLGGTFTTGFEPTESWPNAPWPPVPGGIHSVMAFGGSLGFFFNDWSLSGGDNNIRFPGSQGTRAQATATITPTLVIDSVTDPIGVVFKVAARGTVDANATPHWNLWLDVLDPATGNVVESVGPWGNRYKTDLPKAMVWTRKVAPITAGPGMYQLRFRLLQGASGGSYMALDDVEIYTASDPLPADPLPLTEVSNLVSTTWPPTVPQSNDQRAQRQWLVEQLDRHALAQHAVYSAPGGTAVTNAFTQWFADLAEAAVEHIAACSPGWSEACITKLYSSAYVVKTRHGAFGVDITQGPNPANAVWATNVGMSIPQGVLEKLATQLDFLMITHHHHDHAFYPMVDLMYGLGKPTYGSGDTNPADGESLLERYLAVAPNGPYLNAVAAIVDPPTKQVADTDPLFAGPADAWELRTFFGRQMMDSAIACGASLTQFNFPLNYAFHVTSPDGLRFMAIGDHRDYLDNTNPACAATDSMLTLAGPGGWWPRLQASQLTVDVKIGAGPLVNSVWQDRLEAHFGPLVRIHGHEWEMRHSELSRASASWSNEPPAREQSLPMTFGEHLHFKAFPIAPHVTGSGSGNVTIAFDTAVPVKTVTLHHRSGSGAFTPAVTTLTAAATSHSITLALPMGVYQYYVTTEVENPGDASLGIAQILRDGPRFGNTAELLVFGVP